MSGRITLGISGATPRPLSPATLARFSTISNMSKSAAVALHLRHGPPKCSALPASPPTTSALPASPPTTSDSPSHPQLSSHPQIPSQPGTSSSNLPIINRQPPKGRKPYTCSDKHNAHIRRHKGAAAAKLKQWQDAHNMKKKRCYVCGETKSLSEFYLVGTHASGRCVACKNSPGYPEAHKKHCKEHRWLFSASSRRNTDI